MFPFLFTILYSLTHSCTIQNYSLSTDFTVYQNDDSIKISDTNITLNIPAVMGSWNIHCKSSFVDLTLPFTVKFQFKLDKCGGVSLPRIGNGFSLIIHNQGPTGTLGTVGSNLGCCPGNSVSVMFDFLLPKPLYLKSMTTNVPYTMDGTDPTGKWLPSEINITKCGITYDVIVNYDGVYLSAYLESIDMPWFCYKTNFAQLVSTSRYGNISWGLGCGADHLEFTLMNVTTYKNCTANNIFTKKPPYICTCDGICKTNDTSPYPNPNPYPNPIPQKQDTTIVGYGEQFIVEDRIAIFQNLTIEEGAILKIENGTAIVDDFINHGDLEITLSDNSTTPLIVHKCSHLGGTLVVDATKLPSTDQYTIIKSLCISGNFTEVQLITSSGVFECTTTYINNALILFKFTCCSNDSPNSSVPIKLIAGCVIGFLALIGIVISVIGYSIRQSSYNVAMRNLEANE